MKPMWAARSREHMVDAPAARTRRSRLLWSAGAVVPGAYGWAVSPMPALSRCTASSRPPSQLELNYSPTPGRVTEVSKASVTCTGRCPSEPRPRTPPRSCHACIGSLLCSNDGCWRSTRAGSGPTRSTTTSTNSPSASIGVTRAPVACSSTDCFTKPSGLRLTHTAHSSAAASTDPPPAPIAPESRSSGHCNEGDSPTVPNGSGGAGTWTSIRSVASVIMGGGQTMSQANTTAAPDLARTQPLDAEDLRLIDAYWRAANYLSVGQIYLLDNPLLTRPLKLEDIKPRLLGHWGTTPGLNLIYAHAGRAIKKRSLNAIYIMGPGHGGPAGVANSYLEGSYTERYPDVTMDETGLRKLFRQFSFPGGIPSHNAPETPGSIHEGGELGYALVHAYGAAFDNPSLKVFCIIGDGEAESGPLAASWHSNKFLNPARDGAVLPILHLNGFKIANPTVLARIPEGELLELM